MSWFKRAPDETITVHPSPSTTANEAMTKMALFSKLVTDHNLDLIDSGPAHITLKGRPKNVARFRAVHGVFHAQNLV